MNACRQQETRLAFALLMEKQSAPEQPTPSTPTITDRAGTRRFRAGAGIVVIVAVGLILWLALRDTGGSGSSNATGDVSAATEQQVKNLAASVGHQIYWVGPKPGYTYELTQNPNGSIIIRYLPPGVKIGDSNPYLTVATYPFANALAGIQSVKGSNIVAFGIPKGGAAEYTKSYPASVHLAYPESDNQVEVYDPTPGNAKAIALSGQVSALGQQSSQTSTTAAPPKPTAATLAGLRGVAKSLGHALYWVGPKTGDTYELTQSGDGKAIIRYLPPGVQVGTPKVYLSVATYPFPGAYGATKALGKQSNVETLKLPAGGIAVIAKSYPKSIHVAWPGTDYQVEVFDPSAAKARQLVSSGQISTIG
jgi:hypothetical protein